MENIANTDPAGNHEKELERILLQVGFDENRATLCAPNVAWKLPVCTASVVRGYAIPSIGCAVAI